MDVKNDLHTSPVIQPSKAENINSQSLINFNMQTSQAREARRLHDRKVYDGLKSLTVMVSSYSR